MKLHTVSSCYPLIEEDSGDMDVDTSENSSLASLSRTSSSSSVHQSPSSQCLSSDSGSVDTSDKEQIQFNPEEYLLMHKKALQDRSRHGAGGPRMKLLYRYWCEFLQDHFNDAMYLSFLKLAQEDAAHGHIFGLRHLFKFLKKRLAASFDTDLFSDLELLAHRFHDYLDYDYGLRCLLELMTMGTEQKVTAAGCPLSPLTVALLDAWRQYVDACADAGSMDAGGTDAVQSTEVRRKLHQQLAEKRKRRSKTRQAAARASSPQEQQVPGGLAMGGREATGMTSRFRSQDRLGGSSSVLQQWQGHLGLLHKGKSVLRAKARPWLPQAQPRPSSHPEAQRLPDRLGELLGN